MMPYNRGFNDLRPERTPKGMKNALLDSVISVNYIS